jgi:hypothetical protein
MNDDTADLHQTEDDVLTYAVSDETLEAAAGTTKGAGSEHALFLLIFRLSCVLTDRPLFL